jgi:hypothetical protein
MLLNLPGLPLLDHVVEIGEERVGVVRAGGGLGVILDGENGQLLVAQALDSVVVQVDLGDDRAALLQRLGVGGEAVVLRRDRDLAGLEVLHRLVAAAVAELELESRAAERVGEHLMTEADAEDRVVRQQAADGLVDVGQGGRVAGAVREEHRVHAVFAHLLVSRCGGEHMHVEAVADELAEDGELRAVVEGRNLELLLRRDRQRPAWCRRGDIGRCSARRRRPASDRASGRSCPSRSRCRPCPARPWPA